MNPTMIPTVGRIVLYTLTDQDATEINRRRTDGQKIRERMQVDPPQWPSGAQAHIGNDVHAGDVFPMVICRRWGATPESAVNGQVLLDGNGAYWATSRVNGDNLGNWQWPPRV